MSKRLPPHSAEAEASLIGAALIRPSLLSQIRGLVDPSDFYRPAFQHIWQGMLELHDVGAPIDMVTVKNQVGDLIEAGLLNECFNATPAVSAASRYAEIVVENSRRRALIQHHSEMAEACYDHPADEVLGMAADLPAHLLRRSESDAIDGLFTLSEFIEHANQTKAKGEWLVPHILRSHWRVILVAAEGVGKAVTLRWIGLHAAAGRDPWCPTTRVIPRRVVYIDCENSESTQLHQIRLANQDIDWDAECGDHYFVWNRESGLNLRDRRVQAELERVLQQTRPEIVLAGPLYKLMRRTKGEDMEQATIEMLEVLDDFRTRFNFALMLEHHAPKGDAQTYRVLTAFGSSALLRWPEFGITLDVVGNPTPDEELITVDVGRFRRDREPADWPTTMTRGALGQRTAWTGRWPNGRNRDGRFDD